MARDHLVVAALVEAMAPLPLELEETRGLTTPMNVSC